MLTVRRRKIAQLRPLAFAIAVVNQVSGRSKKSPVLERDKFDYH